MILGSETDSEEYKKQIHNSSFKHNHNFIGYHQMSTSTGKIVWTLSLTLYYKSKPD